MPAAVAIVDRERRADAARDDADHARLMAHYAQLAAPNSDFGSGAVLYGGVAAGPGRRSPLHLPPGSPPIGSAGSSRRPSVEPSARAEWRSPRSWDGPVTYPTTPGGTRSPSYSSSQVLADARAAAKLQLPFSARCCLLMLSCSLCCSRT